MRLDKKVKSVALSIDNKFIVSGSSDRTVRLFINETGEKFIVGIHEDKFISVTISSDN